MYREIRRVYREIRRVYREIRHVYREITPRVYPILICVWNSNVVSTVLIKILTINFGGPGGSPRGPGGSPQGPRGVPGGSPGGPQGVNYSK